MFGIIKSTSSVQIKKVNIQLFLKYANPNYATLPIMQNNAAEQELIFALFAKDKMNITSMPGNRNSAEEQTL